MESSVLTIRNATPGDAEAIAELNAAAWKVGFRGLMPDAFLAEQDGSPDVRRNDLLEPEPDAVEYVAVNKEGLPVGWLAANPAQELDLDSASTYEVKACYTHPDHWRQGVARALMQTLLRQLVGSKWKSIILWTPRDTVRSRAFYESLGFVCDGSEQQVEYGVPVILVRYQKKL